MPNNTDEINIFKDKELLIKYYEIQTSDFRMRHSAIWFEVKHYTWVLSFLIGAGPIALTTGKTIESQTLWILFILAAVGFFISIIAHRIITRDLRYYTRTDSRLLYLEKCLGVINEENYLEDRLLRAKKENFSVNEDWENQLSDISWFKKLSKIRVLILLTFVIYGLSSLILTLLYLKMILCPSP